MWTNSKWIGRLTVLLFLLCFFNKECATGADLPGGKVVWWTRDWSYGIDRQTNGVLEDGDEILTNVVSIAAQNSNVLLLMSDGTVISKGPKMSARNDVPPGLSDVARVFTEGNSCWAVKRDGTVVRWGAGESDATNVVGSLTNISAITWAGYHSYLALKRDGTVLAIRLNLEPTEHPTEPVAVTVNSRPLTNIAALAPMNHTPLALDNDGAVFRLDYQIPGRPIDKLGPGTKIFAFLGAASGRPPYAYSLATPVTIEDKPLTNVVAVSSGVFRALFVKRDGTVAMWNTNLNGSIPLPRGLNNVTAVASGGGQDLALKRDGTVVAWGDNVAGQISVPVGLSNVIAIAVGDQIGMAITTGNIPSSVYVRPHGRLEELAQKADLVFKGQVESTAEITNKMFPDWGKTHATVFKILSVLQGSIDTNRITVWHLTHGPNAWGGGGMPTWHEFQPGECYLAFLDRLNKAEYIYTVPADAGNRPNEFRQMYREGFTRTLDARVLTTTSVKEAHWQELNLMLQDAEPTNVLYAIQKLDGLSTAGRQGDQWERTEDFKRARVLSALLPLTGSTNEQIAIRAINCFATDSNAVATLQPFANTLIELANRSPSSNVRIAAINSLSGTHGEEVAAALRQLLKDPAEEVRVSAVQLVQRFPKDYATSALRLEADDVSANVRSAVADVIGEVRHAELLPTLAKLFGDPVGKDSPIPPLTMEQLKAGQRWSNGGDVHTSAGMALVKFPPGEVSAILETNLNDPGFHINFVAKLAQGDPKPWLPELVRILEARRAHVLAFDKLSRDDPKRYADLGGDKMLTGTYTKCWEDVRQYLLKQSPEQLSTAEDQRYMDLLESMVRHSPSWPDGPVEGARWLYELYWTKNLKHRARGLREKFDKTDGWWFDAFEKGLEGRPYPVDAPVF